MFYDRPEYTLLGVADLLLGQLARMQYGQELDLAGGRPH
jgi:hypothetical protein